MFLASMAEMYPSRGAFTRRCTGAAGSSETSYTAEASPPWAVTMSASFLSAAPLSMDSSSRARASASSAARPLRTRILLPSTMHSSLRSGTFSPLSTAMASFTSRALPTAKPSGWSMSVTTAAILRPACLPTFTISRARVKASFSFSIKAPEPVFTSRTMVFAPEASFLDMMLLTMSGMELTVAVTSRRAYIFLSAGARFAVWPAMTKPTVPAISRKRSGLMDVEKPGKDSSLSMVPPVWPRPRPDIFAILAPHAATIGQSTSEVLSPTPPVECLSAVKAPSADRSTISPEWAMAMVSAVVSGIVMPRNRIAIMSADIW